MRHTLATIASGLIAAVALAASWAWAQGIVLTVGALCAALVGIVAAVRTISALRPVRWLARTLIGDPVIRAAHRVLDEWAERIILPRLAAVEAQFVNNGGSTLRDRVDATATAVGAAPAPNQD